MTTRSLDFDFEDAERAQLLGWVSLSAGAKIDFFEEMVELAYRSGALSPQRLALRDQAPSSGVQHGVGFHFPKR